MTASNSPQLVALSEPGSAAAEAIFGVADYLMNLRDQQGARGVAICGVLPGEGVSFLATNLAIMIAQAGRSVLLIDADLRTPSLEALIPTQDQSGGLLRLLESESLDWDEAIQGDVLPGLSGLSVLYAGGVASHPQELLSGTRFRDVIDFCLREFDLTIINTPPASMSADAITVSAKVRQSVIVARRDVTFVDDLNALAEQLRQCGAVIVGCVLNEA